MRFFSIARGRDSRDDAHCPAARSASRHSPGVPVLQNNTFQAFGVGPPESPRTLVSVARGQTWRRSPGPDLSLRAKYRRRRRFPCRDNIPLWSNAISYRGRGGRAPELSKISANLFEGLKARLSGTHRGTCPVEHPRPRHTLAGCEGQCPSRAWNGARQKFTE